jgi:phage terminase large subunit GpA-like protein
MKAAGELFANIEGVSSAIQRATAQLRPPPDLKPSEWVEANIRIPAGNAVPGPMRLDNAPYQREPMDMLVHPDCYRETLMWGAQVGKTMTALGVQGYCISLQPRSQMMMQPSQGDLHTWLETKFNPLVEANPSIRKLVAKPRGRDGVNNRQMKSYPGGFLMFAWSGSPKTMRGRSAPLIVCDEVDGYEVTEEGHPVGLLWQRAATFGDARFLLEISTPTIKGSSYIEKGFDAGDQRRFHVCCPDCDHEQTLKWKNVTWTGRRSTGIDDADLDAADDAEHQPETARIVCEACGSLWDDGQRIAVIRGGRWIAAKPFRGHASYHLNELYSTFRRLRDIVQSYLDKLATDDLQTFVNVSLAETWEEKGEQVDATGLMARRVAFSAQVPLGGVYLTAGIDMQNDRLEVEVVAWGVGEESWSVAYVVLWGDTLQQDVWEDLDGLLAETWQHESGAHLPIAAACLDTGGTGGHTQAAYDYAKGKTGRRLFAVKGGGTWGSPIVAAPSRKQSGRKARKVDLFTVGVDEAKLTVMRRLNVVRPGPGYCHFPSDRDEEYFRQLTAERLVTRYVKGFPIREWYKPDRARNEALDCRVYALAALKIMNPNLKRLAQRMGVLDQQVQQAAPDDQNAAPPEWAARTAEQAVRLRDVLVAAHPASHTASNSLPRLQQAENPQEDQKPAAPQDLTTPGRRRLKTGGGRNWAKKW